jgi:hypothetical protein
VDPADAARSAFYVRLEGQVDPQGRLRPDKRPGTGRGTRILRHAQFLEGKDPPAFHVRLQELEGWVFVCFVTVGVPA